MRYDAFIKIMQRDYQREEQHNEGAAAVDAVGTMNEDVLAFAKAFADQSHTLFHTLTESCVRQPSALHVEDRATCIGGDINIKA